ncbi:MAG: hypothetical protein P8168_15215 [Deltaproteobacteria bacterium]
MIYELFKNPWFILAGAIILATLSILLGDLIPAASTTTSLVPIT